jgi:VanZ family protein
MPGLRACLKLAFTAGVALVVILSLLPAKSLPPLGVSDKLEHFAAYAILGLIGGFAFPTQRTMALLMAFLVALAVLLELGQWFVPGRSPEARDAIASGFGACTTLCAHLLLGWLVRTRKMRVPD